jgi:hypothetical protein
VGIGGLSPFPGRGPITALRVLGRGFEIPVDADRSQQLARVMVGEKFVYKGQLVLAIDEPTRQLIEPLTAYCGLGARNDVDAVLLGILCPYPKYPIILHGARSEDVSELARTIHEHTIRKGFPFTPVNTVPTSDAAIEALCTQAGCGTLFLDLTTPGELPPTLVRHLFPQGQDHYHLGTIAVASAAEHVPRCFGLHCSIGFRRAPWYSAMHNVKFTPH